LKLPKLLNLLTCRKCDHKVAKRVASTIPSCIFFKKKKRFLNLNITKKKAFGKKKKKKVGERGKPERAFELETQFLEMKSPWVHRANALFH